ncbi:MAG: ABC1 kinase family protein [Gammaproteobacteria bacterium]
MAMKSDPKRVMPTHKVPTSRTDRFGLMGRLALGVAGGMLSEGSRRVLRGQWPSLQDVLLTPANVNRVAETLSKMRGAAMKLGQLISMDSGQILSPELSALLDRLRGQAHVMPLGQVGQQLEQAWGPDWTEHFQKFHFTPIAAASIGQVHEAWLKDGRHVAVKLQYPNIAQSINSDVDNAASLFSWLRLLPEDVDVTTLLEQAKTQLHAEADYVREAEHLRNYAELLGSDARFKVPELIDALCTREVLVMEFLPGESIEQIAVASHDLRQRTAEHLVDLAFQEIFNWGVVQTDPNYANYLFDHDNARVQLIDFGATRNYAAQEKQNLLGLLAACVDGNEQDILQYAEAVGYLTPHDTQQYRRAVLELLNQAVSPLRVVQPYAFAESNLVEEIQDSVLRMQEQGNYGSFPPIEVLLLHRKMAGLFLLLQRLQVSIDLRKCIQCYLSSVEI